MTETIIKLIKFAIYCTGAVVWALIAARVLYLALRKFNTRAMKWRPYAWVHESIIYLFAMWRLRRKMRIMKHAQIVQYWDSLTDGDGNVKFWWGPYWFGRRYRRAIEDKLLETKPKK